MDFNVAHAFHVTDFFLVCFLITISNCEGPFYC